MDEETRTIFIDEGKEISENVIASINILKDDPNNKKEISEIFRALHTLKGNVGFAGLPGLSFLFKNIVEFFRPVNDGIIPMSLSILEQLHSIANIIKDAFTKFENGEVVSREEANQILCDISIPVVY